ncbi:Uncharacterised protein [Mycobacteroides abscessus subsp. abscessus]|nr:Uncharacterised protein [Mycobacteroides abscessus subsp. abscessus]
MAAAAINVSEIYGFPSNANLIDDRPPQIASTVITLGRMRI